MTRLRRLAILLLLLGAVIWASVAYWPVYLPPETPAMVGSRVDAAAGKQRVFGYATLMHPLVRWVVVGRPVPAGPASLDDLRRVGRDILPAPGATLDGLVFDVTPQGLSRLDRYERLGERYRRDLMTLTDGSTAWVYSRLP